MWNVSIETLTNYQDLGDDGADEVMGALIDFHPALYRGDFGGVGVVISLEAESVRHAAITGMTLVEAAGLSVRTLEVMSSDDYDAGGGTWDDVSVTDAAEQLGVTRQAILKRIKDGALPARKIGDAWVVSRAGLRPKGQRRSGTIRVRTDQPHEASGEPAAEAQEAVR